MRIISKIIVWVFSLLLVFIVVNLLIWSYKMEWVGNYMQLLNNKDWSQSISQVYITNPTSIFSIFSIQTPGSTWQQIGTLGSPVGVLETGDIQDIINTWNSDTETWDELDPYDPEFEDEFNSFFGWEESDSNTITWETIDLDVEDITKINQEESQESWHTVWEALIKKFNE